MNDLKEVLAKAVDDLAPRDEVTDPAPDLRRARSVLRRRRALRAGATLVGAAAVAIALVPALAKSPAPVRPVAVPHTSHHATQHSGPAVRLVGYTGAQPPGYTVKEIPVGWVIQGSNPWALVIAPANDPDKHWDSFLGKIMVGWQDFAGTSADGQLVRVNGRPGYYQANSGDNTQMLMFEGSGGRWLSVQTPAILHWRMSQVITFAAGVTVLPGAQQSHG